MLLKSCRLIKVFTQFLINLKGTNSSVFSKFLENGLIQVMCIEKWKPINIKKATLVIKLRHTAFNEPRHFGDFTANNLN